MEKWTKEQLNNWISNKQCCLAEYEKKVVKKGEIGSKDFKCCMNKFILANIYLEMLTCMSSDRISSNYTSFVRYNSNNTSNPHIYTILLNGTVIYPTTLAVLGSGDTAIAEYLKQIFESTGLFTVELNYNLIGHIGVEIYSLDETHDGDEITLIIEQTAPPEPPRSYTVTLSGGKKDDTACLTREEQCKLIDFINDICNKC